MQTATGVLDDARPAGEAPQPPGGRVAWRPGLVASLPATLHGLSLVAAFAFLAYVDRNMWFRVDDFDFLGRRGLHGADLSIWQPHNDHWTTLPILLYRLLFSIFGLRTAQPYLFCLFVLHLAVAHVLWRAMRRMGVEPYVATALAAVFAVLGAGATNLLWSFQVCYVGAVLLGWIFVLLVDRDGGLSGRDLVAGFVGLAALMTAGTAVTMLAVGGLVILARRGVKVLLVVLGPPAATYLVWFVVAARPTWVHPPFHQALLDMPAYTANGIAAAASGAVGSSDFGPVLAVLLGIWAFRSSAKARTVASPAYMGLVGAVAFFVVSAFGPDAAASTNSTVDRYAYVAVALALPAIGLAVSSVVQRRPLRIVIALALLGLVAISNVDLLLVARDRLTSQSQFTKQQVVAAATVAETERTIPGSLPLANPSTDGPDLRLTVLVQWSRDGVLPAGVHPSEVALLDAAAQIQLGVTTGPLFASAAVIPTATATGDAAPTGSSVCASPLSYQALPSSETLSFSAPASLMLRSTGQVQVGGEFRSGSVSSDQRQMTLPAGDSYLDVATSDYGLELSLPGGVGLATCAGSP